MDLKNFPCEEFLAGRCRNSEAECVWSHAVMGDGSPRINNNANQQPQLACCVCRQALVPSRELTFPCGHFLHVQCCGPWQVRCPAPKCPMSIVGDKFGDVYENHPLVWEAIVAFSLAAINSARYEWILTPFPEVRNYDGSVFVDSATKKDIVKLREVAAQVRTVMEMIRISYSVPRHVSSLVNWIINSNTSAIKRIAKPIPFMESAHQFLFIQSTQKHTQAFLELKKTRRTQWAFHGSKPENWHSIIRNGLVNASNTALMTTGAVYGAGVYLSPHAAVSYPYSGMKGGIVNAKPVKDADGITHGAFFCITICEVIEEGLKRSKVKDSTAEIWVQPNESYVMTRFLFVFNANNIGGASAVLTDPQYIAQLEQAVSDNWA